MGADEAAAGCVNPICKVATCDRPVAEAHVCTRCAHQLERALGDIPAVVHQLNLTLAKQTRYADRAERGGNEQPLPMDPQASAAASELRAHLVGWVRLVAEERGWALPEDTLDAMSRWMLHHVEWLRHHQAGHDAVEELTGDMRTAQRVIDRPPDRWYAGPCTALMADGLPCGADMYAQADKGNVGCPDCGAVYDVAKRRAWLLAEAEDTLATTTEVCRALTTLAGVELTAASIRGYVHRGQLMAHGIRDGKQTFRLGDVVVLVMTQATTRKAG
jgi:hypothetical protein